MQEELQGYANYLSRMPISEHTRRNYLQRIKKFLERLADSPDGVKALTDQIERDFAVQDYKTHLLQSGKSSNTINAVLSAIDNFYLYKGMGPVKVKRHDLPAQAPRALEPEELRRLLKEIARCKSKRNRTLALVMLNCGLRISEVAQLDIGDVLLMARKRELVVRCGKNSKRRTVPINSDLAEVMREYLASVRGSYPEMPLFLSQKGNRLSVQAIDYIIRQFGRDAGVDLSSHTLRHSCLTLLVRSGVDIVTVAEIAGHSRLETSRRYSLPTEAVKIAAMEKIGGTAQA
ncbi:MAG: tyrosine-type recombinase/integrase [Microbacteriaceae bacterium]|nr:tyrosine-type recombinase/integrase [Microbacteriaceae bacterium]